MHPKPNLASKPLSLPIINGRRRMKEERKFWRLLITSSAPEDRKGVELRWERERSFFNEIRPKEPFRERRRGWEGSDYCRFIVCEVRGGRAWAPHFHLWQYRVVGKFYGKSCNNCLGGKEGTQHEAGCRFTIRYLVYLWLLKTTALAEWADWA